MEFHVAEFVKLYTLLRDRGVDVWVDGGWGVDALLGEQTRSHRDLDLAVEARNEGGLRALLLSLGYADKPREDTSAWNYVLADAAGHEVDVHVITFDERGNGIYGPPENGEMYSRFRATRGLRGKAPLGGIDEPQR